MSTALLIWPQVFGHAKVYFSPGNNQFNGEPVHFSYMPDLVLEQARDVTIKLHSRAGRFVKLQLYFAARWIMISEVVFDSGMYFNIFFRVIPWELYQKWPGI